MLEQLGEAVSTYDSLKEVLPAPQFGEHAEKPRGRKPYAHLLPMLAGAFLFVEGLSLWETRRTWAYALIAASVLIGAVVPLVGIIRQLKNRELPRRLSENPAEPTGGGAYSEEES